METQLNAPLTENSSVQESSKDENLYFKAPEGALSAAGLAYIGDAIFELLVRERLLSEGGRNGNRLNKRAAGMCSAAGQARAASVLLPMLSEEEADAYRRGRNAALSIAKKRHPDIHCAATGLEALFGQCYLSGNRSRLLELFEVCYQAAR